MILWADHIHLVCGFVVCHFQEKRNHWILNSLVTLNKSICIEAAMPFMFSRRNTINMKYLVSLKTYCPSRDSFFLWIILNKEINEERFHRYLSTYFQPPSSLSLIDFFFWSFYLNCKHFHFWKKVNMCSYKNHVSSSSTNQLSCFISFLSFTFL